MKETSAEAGRESIHFDPLAAIAAYQAAPPAEARDFDFLVGDWNVHGTRFDADGQPALTYRGRWHAEHLDGGRMIFDSFSASLDGGGGIAFVATLRTWSPLSRRWEMTFLYAMQPQLLDRFTGQRRGNEMHLSATGRDGRGRVLEARVRFYDITSDGFSWEQKTSRDGGRSWILEASIKARR